MFFVFLFSLFMVSAFVVQNCLWCPFVMVGVVLSFVVLWHSSFFGTFQDLYAFCVVAFYIWWYCLICWVYVEERFVCKFAFHVHVCVFCGCFLSLLCCFDMLSLR